MATIRPFRGVRYNPEKIDDLSTVISQPYDRVRHGLQDKYYDQSPHTIVRIIKGRENPGDDEQDNVYTRARDYFQAWLKEGVLMREDTPALYVLHQTFTLPNGNTKTRKGLITALELSRFNEGVVLPHERTCCAPQRSTLATSLCSTPAIGSTNCWTRPSRTSLDSRCESYSSTTWCSSSGL